MEQGDDGSLELSALIGPNGNGGEGFPHDSLTDVGGNEKWNTRSKTISLLQKLIKHKNHETSDEKLQDNEDGSEETEVADGAIHSGQKISKSFTKCDQKTKQFLGGLE